MNNWIIVIPSLLSAALGVGGLAYGVWQGQNAKAEALLASARAYTKLQNEYRQLQEDHGVDLARADGLEQDNERLTKDLNARSNEINILRERSTEIVSQLSESQAEVERLKEAAPAPKRPTRAKKVSE
jgi:uncharacterized protein HemX